LADASLEQVKQMLASIAPDNERIAEGFYIRLPVITFTEELTLYMESHTIRLILMPGHTPFETAVWVPEERMVFTSDNVVTKGMPFFGHSLPYEWLNSLEHLEELDFDYLVPGHGEISDRAGVAAMRTSLKACIDAVGEAVNSGMSLEEAKDRVNLTDFYPHLAENEKTMRWLERANIARLYTVLKGCS
jgi:cyclase